MISQTWKKLEDNIIRFDMARYFGPKSSCNTWHCATLADWRFWSTWMQLITGSKCLFRCKSTHHFVHSTAVSFLLRFLLYLYRITYTAKPIVHQWNDVFRPEHKSVNCYLGFDIFDLLSLLCSWRLGGARQTSPRTTRHCRLPGGYWSREVPAQVNGGTDQAQRLTQVRGAAAVGLYPLFSFRFFCSLFYPLTFICQRGRRVAEGSSAI